MLSQTIKPYIDQIKRREITMREVADILNVSENHVSVVLKKLKVVREPVVKIDNKALRAARLEYRELVAETMTIKAAAQAAKCSTRTIYRIKKKAKNGA